MEADLDPTYLSCAGAGDAAEVHDGFLLGGVHLANQHLCVFRAAEMKRSTLADTRRG